MCNSVCNYDNYKAVIRQNCICNDLTVVELQRVVKLARMFEVSLCFSYAHTSESQSVCGGDDAEHDAGTFGKNSHTMDLCVMTFLCCKLTLNICTRLCHIPRHYISVN